MFKKKKTKIKLICPNDSFAISRPSSSFVCIVDFVFFG